MYKFKLLEKIVPTLIDEQVMPPIKNREESYQNDLYRVTGYLDAFARILNIQSPCSALTEIQNKLYISFNTVEQKQNTDAINIIKYAINTDNKDDLLSCILLFNINFKEYLKQYRGQVLQAHKKNNLSAFFKDKTKDIINLAEEIIAGNEEAKNIFLSIKRDIDKLNKFDCFKNLDKDDGIVLLQNPNKMHAELVIAEHFIKNPNWQNKYVGVSKLCCYICDNILTHWEVVHRGTHGGLYMTNYSLPGNLEEEHVIKIIESIDKHRSKYWDDVNERITQNNRIERVMTSENASNSDEEKNYKDMELLGQDN